MAANQIIPGLDRIIFDPQVMAGKACIRGMRITVTLVLNLVANGMSAEQIVEGMKRMGDVLHRELTRETTVL